ncbi:hypothetical protein BpHYR1_031177 [Brachionus plicatilis]|uniref:Uncharacterized protein n=1 Tax=Brachionus plicatilis TaxID=10195 RepID=A0A3M7PQC5_BRAPC|nr:hypothetical protein BpHYR1_031177 [Brachionus plicatilis]
MFRKKNILLILNLKNQFLLSCPIQTQNEENFIKLITVISHIISSDLAVVNLTLIMAIFASFLFSFMSERMRYKNNN